MNLYGNLLFMFQPLMQLTVVWSESRTASVKGPDAAVPFKALGTVRKLFHMDACYVTCWHAVLTMAAIHNPDAKKLWMFHKTRTGNNRLQTNCLSLTVLCFRAHVVVHSASWSTRC